LNKYFLESLRKQLGDVDIARKAAADQAEENKNLARDIQDVYEEKMAKVGFQIDWTHLIGGINKPIRNNLKPLQARQKV